jgi:hypothetical protein
MRIIGYLVLSFSFVTLLGCGASATAQQKARSAITPYEYLAVRINQSGGNTQVTAGNPDGSNRVVSLTPGVPFERSVPQLFTKLGSEGWELVVFEPIGPSGYSDPLGFYLFKRPM